MSTVLAKLLLATISLALAGCASRVGQTTASAKDPQVWRENLRDFSGQIARYPVLAAPEPKIERVFTAQERRALYPGRGVEDLVYATEYAIRSSRSGIVEYDRKTVGKSLFRGQNGARRTSDLDNQSYFVGALGGMLHVGLHQRSFNAATGKFTDSGFRIAQVEKVEGVLFPLAIGNRLSVAGELVSYNGAKLSGLSEFVVLERRDGYAGNGIEIGGEIWVIERTIRTKPIGGTRWNEVNTARLYWSDVGNFVIGRETTANISNSATGATTNESREKEMPLFFVVGREDPGAKRDADRFSTGLNAFLASYAEQQFRPILALADLGGADRPPAASAAQGTADPRTAATGGVQPCDNSAGSVIANALIGAGFAALMGGSRSGIISAGNNAVKFTQRPGC